jgi:hypothetical protein
VLGFIIKVFFITNFYLFLPFFRTMKTILLSFNIMFEQLSLLPKTCCFCFSFLFCIYLFFSFFPSPSLFLIDQVYSIDQHSPLSLRLFGFILSHHSFFTLLVFHSFIHSFFSFFVFFFCFFCFI